MKIGILTFHCAHNYGAVLQAYALQTFLLSQGHDAYIIDYRPQYLTDVYKKFDWRRWVSKNPAKFAYHTLRELTLISTRCKRYAAFDNFINTRLRLFPYNQPEDLKAFDLVLLGSDQIWSRAITGGRYDDLFWGLSVPVPVATYAASACNLGQTDADKQYMASALDHLMAISVREDKMVSFLEPLTDKPIYHVSDPTLLLDASNYITLTDSTEIEIPKGPYLLVYQVGRHPTIYNTARAIAKQLGCRIIELAAYANDRKAIGSYMIRTASPEAFLAYIKNAACIVTTSFHGTALSNIFQRPFYTIRWNNSIDERSNSLLKALGLEGRSINANEIPHFTIPNFTNNDIRLCNLRQKAFRYLTDTIALVLKSK